MVFLVERVQDRARFLTFLYWDEKIVMFTIADDDDDDKDVLVYSEA